MGLGLALAVALVAFASAHIALVVGLARRGLVWQAIAALVALPLAPWWGWKAEMRRRTIAWGVALTLYAVGVAVA